MRNKYITATILALMSGGTNIFAEDGTLAPRLVVNITIDQLRTDFLETFEPFYGTDGFKKILRGGRLYKNIQYPFSPIDRASAIAAINTSTTPNLNGITAEQWFDRSCSMSVSCVNDVSYGGLLTMESASAQNVMTSTLSDELKVATKGHAFIYSIAERKETAVIPAGHCGDGAFWVNKQENCWCTSTYYSKKAPKWLETYNLSNTPYKKSSCVNEQITDFALNCISLNSLGKDDNTDILFITYNAAPSIDKDGNENCKDTYIQIDRDLGRLINNIQSSIGLDKVLFVINGTGYYNSLISANKKYLNTKLIDRKRLNINEITDLSKTFVRQCQGIANAYSIESIISRPSSETEDIRRGCYLSRCGDIIIETAPGWDIVNEDTQQQYSQYRGYLLTPAIFYGYNIRGEKIDNPVSVEAISPTIAKIIRIRAPNACKSAPLF